MWTGLSTTLSKVGLVVNTTGFPVDKLVVLDIKSTSAGGLGRFIARPHRATRFRIATPHTTTSILSLKRC